MITELDHLIIAVKDLDEAEKNYEKIFGVTSVWKGAVSYTHLRAHET